MSDEEVVEAAAQTLLRVLTKVQADRRVARTYGTGEPLTMIEMEVCARIADEPGITGSGLADYLGVTASAVSQVVAKLTEKGQVRIERDGSNARVKHLHLTAAGRRAARAIQGRYQQMTTAVLGSSSSRELKTTLRFLERLEAFLDQARAER
jgi:DNA-binding MarR family transcriptional regulator